jgi:uncharacterized membrane protein
LKHATPIVLLFLLAIFQMGLTLSYAITLFYEFKTSGCDGASFAQILFNIINNNGFNTTLNPPFKEQNFLGFHFSPILYLLAPIFYFFPYVETLLFIMSSTIALAAYPIFLTAEHILKSRWLALLIATLYLLNPFVMNAALWDFHEIAFAPLCIAIMFLALIHKKRLPFILLSLVLLSIKEHYGLAVFGFGLLWAWHWRDPKFGLSISAFGIVALCFILMIAMPYFSISNATTMMNATSAIDRFSWLHDPFSATSPLLFLVASGVMYISVLVIPLIFFPLGAFMWLLPAMADIAVNVLSTNTMMRSIFSYHSAAIVPVILVALCVAIGQLTESKTIVLSRNTIIYTVVIISIPYSYALSSLPFAGMPNLWERALMPQLSYKSDDIEALAAIHGLIPSEASVSAQNNIVPHMPIQSKLFQFPNRYEDVDFVVLQLRFPFQYVQDVFGSPYEISGEKYFTAVDKLFSQREWGIVLSKNDWVVLKRHGKDSAEAREKSLKALANVKVHYDNIAKKPTSHPPH